MNIKIHGGVIGNDPGKHGLCSSCANAEIREAYNGNVYVSCGITHPPLPVHQPLVRCTEYREHNQVDRYDMEKIAWIVSTDSKTNKVGFTPPKKEEL
jgi:hypothetical protein